MSDVFLWKDLKKLKGETEFSFVDLAQTSHPFLKMISEMDSKEGEEEIRLKIFLKNNSWKFLVRRRHRGGSPATVPETRNHPFFFFSDVFV